MENINSILQNKYTPYVVGGVVVVVSIPLIKRFFFSRRRKLDISKYPRDKVILFQFPRGPYAPSLSPFALKLETYLRMANIPYQSETGFTLSSKQKIPFIVYDGEELADSHFCIQHLNRVRGVDLNSWLSDKEKSVARAFQIMTEDHLFWVLALFRFWYGPDEPEGSAFMKVAFPGLSPIFLRFFGKKVYDQAYAQGIGRHTKEENMSLGVDDIKAISSFLDEYHGGSLMINVGSSNGLVLSGNKPSPELMLPRSMSPYGVTLDECVRYSKKAFLMGDHTCQEDATIFGLLAQVYWQLPGPIEKLLKGECRNLGDYCERMKDRFWPDWDEHTTQGDTRKAKD